MSIKKTLEIYGESVVDILDKGLDDTGSNASYDLSNSIESNVKESKGDIRLTVSSLSYIFDVDEGRSPEEQEEIGFEALFDDYEDWVNAKNIDVFDDLEDTETMISVMVITSMQEGTVTYRSGESLGIIEGAINNKSIEDLEKDLSNELVNEVLETITKISKNAID